MRIPLVYPSPLAALSLASLLLFAACAEPPGAPTVVSRPVKVEQVGGATSAQASHSFVGTLRAHQRADLSVEAPGRLGAVAVDVGDAVRAGQVLATLDDAPMRWRLDKAQADRAAAAAALAERRTALTQHESLARDHIISPAALEAVQAAHRQAVSQLEAADAALAAARRDLSLTRITAPFDGEVVARLVQAHADVAPGQVLLQLEGRGALEVVLMLPDGLANRLLRGAPAQAVAGDQRLALSLDRIGGRSENGSLVQAVYRVTGKPTGWRSGGVVQVELPVAASPGLSLPASALMPSAEPGQASVFVLDDQAGVLHRRAVQVGRGVLPDGRMPVAAGLNAGDRVVVAGVAFLSDGQPAHQHHAQTALQGARP